MISAVLAKRIIRTASGVVTTSHRIACTHSGGLNVNSTQNARMTITAPRTISTGTTAPSPTSTRVRSSPQCELAGRTSSRLWNNGPSPQRGHLQRRAVARNGACCCGAMLLAGDLARAVPVDEGEQEQPHHVDEMPVPGRGFEAEMPLCRKGIVVGAEPADDQETGADDDVEAVEAGGKEERRRIDAAADELERRVHVFDCLEHGEAQA